MKSDGVLAVISQNESLVLKFLVKPTD